MPAYSTKPGDSLASIAQNAGTTPQDLQKLNPSLATITDPNQQFSSSMVLNLPEPQVSVPQPNLSTPQGQAFATPTGQIIPTPTRQPAKPQQPAIIAGSAEAQGQKTQQSDLQAQLAGIQKQAETIQKALQSSGQDISSGSVARDIAGGVDVSTEPTGAQVELDKLKELYKTQPPPTQSIQDYYNDLATKEGLPALDTKIVNLENIMNGTEQDIRNEIQSGGGFATESQVQALVGARNKTLTIQLNNLLDLRKQRSDYINKQVELKQADAKTAAENFDKAIGYQEKITTLQNTIDNSGFKNSLAYQTFQQKEQTAALKMMDDLNKQGALGSLDADTLKWLSDATGIPENLITKAGTNAAAAVDLKLQVLKNKISVNGGFGGVANMAKAVVNGKLAPSELPGFGLKSLRTQVMDYIYKNLDPNFDSRAADSSFAFQKSQKSNLIQASINSANYAAKQIVELSDKVDRGDIQPINAAELLFKSKTGDINTAKFLSAVKIVGDEYGAVFGQGAATDFKAQLGLAVVDPTFSKEQFRAVVQDTVINLMQARLQAIQEQGTGTGVVGDITNPATTNPTPSTADQSYLQSLGL